MAGYNDPQMQSVLDHIRRYSHSSNNGDPISGKPFLLGPPSAPWGPSRFRSDEMKMMSLYSPNF